MEKEITIEVTDGDKKLSCRLHRPDIATLSRANKMSKADEVLAAQELLKGCWVEGDNEILNDGYLMLAVSSKLGVLSEGIIAEVKNS